MFVCVITEAHADIVGGPDKIVKSGSSLRLTCVLRRSTEPPAYVFWYHGARMINFDLGGGAAVRHGRQSSELHIPKAQKQHAGNYSCVPSNARPASVNVHVLQGQSSIDNTYSDTSVLFIIAASTHLYLVYFDQRHHTAPELILNKKLYIKTLKSEGFF